MIDKEVSLTFDRRSALFLGAGAILTSVLVMRMLQLQVFNYGTYKRKALNNSIRLQVNLPERGRILAKDGSSLAYDTPVYRAYIIPEETDNIEELIKESTRELKLKPAEISKIRKSIEKQRKFQPTLIRESLGWEQLAKLQSLGLNGLHIEQGYSRRYPLGDAAAQVIGYIGMTDRAMQDYQRLASKSQFFMTGISGLERAFDRSLAGRAGQHALIADAMGQIVGEDESLQISEQAGTNLNTTISDNLQKRLADLLKEYKSGAGIVMDATNGAILAMVSAPGFDPNIFRTEGGSEYSEKLNKDPLKPFMNKALEGLYPPGSVFKIIVALAALESGALTPTEKIFCPGKWEYGNHLYHCWEAKGHGWENLSDALAHSCDIYFYQVALRIGIDVIKSMAERLGLGQMLLNTLPREAAGIIPDKKWKERNIGSTWYHGDTIISGIGQGFILTNCVQLATMMARVATNKKVVPYIIANELEKNKVDGLGLKNSRLVLGGLERVTKQGGTAAGAAINVRGMRMGGKTGTSQVRTISKKERESGVLTNDQLAWQQRNHGLFVGYAPTDNPKYIVAVITEHAGSSGPAAFVASQVMREALKNA